MLKTMNSSQSFPQTRLRRLRQNSTLRRMVQDVNLQIKDFVLPLFIHHENSFKKPINSMPGHFQIGIDHLSEEIHLIKALNIQAVILFGIPDYKDAQGSASWHKHGVVQQAIQLIKKMAPEILVIAD